MKTIGIIGLGNMGSAITHNLAAKKKWKIFGSNPAGEKLRRFRARHRRCCPSVRLLSNSLLSKSADVLILAVKPYIVESVLADLSPSFPKNSLLLSIAAGVKLKTLTKFHQNCVRVMPSLPAQIGMGFSGWIAAKKVSRQGKSLARAILQSFGEEKEFVREDSLNAVTAMSGSGPGYVFYLLEHFVKAGERMGLSKEVAKKLVLQTCLGSVLFAKQSSEDFENLRKQIQTKGGTTEAAIRYLEANRWGTIFEKALEKAYRKAADLG